VRCSTHQSAISCGCGCNAGRPWSPRGHYTIHSALMEPEPDDCCSRSRADAVLELAAAVAKDDVSPRVVHLSNLKRSKIIVGYVSPRAILSPIAFLRLHLESSHHIIYRCLCVYGRHFDCRHLDCDRRGCNADVALKSGSHHPGRLGVLSVSREHCEIFQSAVGDWVISDLGSRNGCFVNGKHAVAVSCV